MKKSLNDLSMKNVCLFVLFVMFEISQTMVPLVVLFDIVGKPSMMSASVPNWFHNVSTYNGEVIKH
jgi:hypothetical protein